MRYFTLLLIFIGIGHFGTAQDVSFGPKLGFNIATQTGDISNEESIGGFRGGAFVNIGLSEKFSLQPELLYSRKGVEQSFSQTALFGTINVNSSYQLDYLSVPIMAKYQFLEIRGFKVFANAGPYFDFLLNANAEASVSAFGQSETTDTTATDFYNTLDFGFAFGTGATYDIGPGKVLLNLRYSLGVSNIATDDLNLDINTNTSGGGGIGGGQPSGNNNQNQQDSDPVLRNSVFSIGVGYAF